MDERDSIHLALQGWIERDDVCLHGPVAELSRVPAALDDVDQRIDQQRLLELELVDAVLHDGECLSEFLIGGLQRGDVGCHVRGF
jgi:hypothetical protein